MSFALRWITAEQGKLLKCERSEKGYDTFCDTPEKPQPRQVIDNSGDCARQENPSRIIGRQPS